MLTPLAVLKCRDIGGATQQQHARTRGGDNEARRSCESCDLHQQKIWERQATDGQVGPGELTGPDSVVVGLMWCKEGNRP
eukprot:COSAG02_NODE_14116_length_1308_cov_1.326716_3_plen_79_part_01